MFPNEQLRLAPEIEHGLPAGCEAIDHVIPVPVGSGSESVTFVACPTPLLVTVMVKPIGLPALTDAASAVFVMAKVGARTVKHSNVVSVCSPWEYSAVDDGENSARKQ
jgi:hypothetical protein